MPPRGRVGAVLTKTKWGTMELGVGGREVRELHDFTSNGEGFTELMYLKFITEKWKLKIILCKILY